MPYPRFAFFVAHSVWGRCEYDAGQIKDNGRSPMRPFSVVLASLAVGVTVASCAAPVQTFERAVYGDPAKPYFGKTKAEMIACAGAPFATYKTDTAETLTYHYSGAGPVPGEVKKKDDDQAQGGMFGAKKQDKNYKCTASLVFENDRLVRVNFAPRVIITPYTRQEGQRAEGEERQEGRCGRCGRQRQTGTGARPGQAEEDPGHAETGAGACDLHLRAEQLRLASSPHHSGA